MGANPQYARSAEQGNPSLSGSPKDTSATKFISEFEELVKNWDPAVEQFVTTYEARKGIKWLEEADQKRGLENALLKVVSGFPAGTDSPAVQIAGGEKTPSEGERSQWYKRLCKATRAVTEEYPEYFRLVERISIETKSPLNTLIKKLLIGYATSPNHGYASAPW